MTQIKTADYINKLRKAVNNIKRFTLASFIITIGFFISVYIMPTSFNIEQKLIDGNKAYTPAETHLSITKAYLKSAKRRLDDHLKHLAETNKEKEQNINLIKHEQEVIARDGEGMTSWARTYVARAQEKLNSLEKVIKNIEIRIGETTTSIDNLNVKYTTAKAAFERLEPIKAEYDKQVKKELERISLWHKIADYTSTIAIVFMFLTALSFILWGQNKQRLSYLEGKMTKEEYEQTLRSSISSFSSEINPSTGLPMSVGGICDVGGTPRGGTSSDDWHYKWR